MRFVLLLLVAIVASETASAATFPRLRRLVDAVRPRPRAVWTPVQAVQPVEPAGCVDCAAASSPASAPDAVTYTGPFLIRRTPVRTLAAPVVGRVMGRCYIDASGRRVCR